MAAPSQIAHYQITSKLGEGGMGAVYRAIDTKLHRDVAIKVLPAAFAADSSRMARFEREALLLASLNHPNIAAIYGIEQGAIVMELIDGADLAGPLPIDTVIDYARQIAAGLEAAHEKGIVHRDLKPANIKVTRGGQIKILDFGLAKASEAAPQPGNPSISPTLPLGMTEAGVILGTAAYMSPEQARGKPVDQRADIWAFGVVLYELVTGRRLFEGEDLTDTLAAVVKTDPNLTAVPEPIRRVLQRCLQKDPNKRLRHISSVELLLEEPGAPPAPVAPRARTAPLSVARGGVVRCGGGRMVPVLAPPGTRQAGTGAASRFPCRRISVCPRISRCLPTEEWWLSRRAAAEIRVRESGFATWIPSIYARCRERKALTADRSGCRAAGCWSLRQTANCVRSM